MRFSSARPRRDLVVAALGLTVLFGSAPGLSSQEAGSGSRPRLFGSVGLGAGAVDCFNDTGCYPSMMAGARVGVRVVPTVRLALGIDAFTHDEIVGTLYSIQALYSPGARNFHLLLGGGIASDEGRSGLKGGLTAGVGYDIPLNRKGSFALTPFARLTATTIGDPNWIWVHGGLSLTLR